LRGVGLTVLARAYLHCHRHTVPYTEMATKLATLEWNVLRCERTDLPPATEQDPFAYQNAVRANAHPLWGHLLIVGEDRYRISSTADDADLAWHKICGQLFPQHLPQPSAQAAE